VFFSFYSNVQLEPNDEPSFMAGLVSPNSTYLLKDCLQAWARAGRWAGKRVAGASCEHEETLQQSSCTRGEEQSIVHHSSWSWDPRLLSW